MLPGGKKLPNPEWLYRGGLEGEPRQEVRRVNQGDAWFYADSGAPVQSGKTEFVEGGERKAVDAIEVDPSNPYRGKLRVLNRDIGAVQIVQVIKRRVKKVIFDEARAAHDFPRLSAETFLPQIMVSDSRPPRGQHEQMVIEDIATAKVVEAEGEAA